jgi:hypothetical protein
MCSESGLSPIAGGGDGQCPDVAGREVRAAYADIQPSLSPAGATRIRCIAFTGTVFEVNR